VTAPGVAVFALRAIALAAALAGCNQQAKFQPPPPPRVTVAAPLVEPVQEDIFFTGQTEAYLSVDLVARVSGFLREVKFVDGADVAKDQVLFIIEPEPYQVQVELAQATIDQHQALLKSAEAEFERQQALQKQQVSTQANYDKALANRDSERASVAEAQANLQTAQINLGYTSVAAPFAGRMGRRQVDPGNLVGSGSATKLATLSDIDTIYAYFTINERDIPRLREAMRDNNLTREQLRTVPIFAGLANDKGTPFQGHLDFIDTGLDPGTGTLQARAVFDNKQRQLLPGLFVRLRLPLGPAKPATLVPVTAIAVDQVGPYVLVVDGASNVALRRVTLGSQERGLQVITAGLGPNDKVIIDGAQNATPGRPATVEAGKIASAALAQP
jgi:RND family efflux transporter MFP subunit